MFEEYSSEIIAFVAIIILFAIYEIIKFKNASETKKKKTLKKVSILIPDEYDDNNGAFHDVIHNEVKEKLKKQRETEEFLVETEPEQEVEEETTEYSTTSHFIERRSVPPHGKITKDDFKEFSGQRILIAEDNIINQKVIKGLLADSGIEIVIANDGQEALDILEEDINFLMILMDAHMPKVDGFEATRTIRQNPKYDKILVVALSGDIATDDIKKMKEAGMSEHLEKPLKIDKFYDILYAYSGKSSAVNDTSITEPFDTTAGLEICGGDRDFYGEILNEFLSMYQNSAHELSDFLHTESFKEADKLLLDIIGVSANIGAKPLNKTASSIKTAILNKNKEEYSELITLYKKQLDNLISDIKNYLKNH